MIASTKNDRIGLYYNAIVYIFPHIIKIHFKFKASGRFTPLALNFFSFTQNRNGL